MLLQRKIRRAAAVAVVLALVIPVILLMSGVLPYRAFVVQTGSMSPTVPPASLVVVKAGEYEIGQAITFHKHNELVTHRLVKANTDGTLTTKGDANASADPSTIARSDVIGGVVFASAGLGYWAMYFRNPLTIASLLLFLLTFWYMWPEARVKAQTAEGAQLA